MKVLALDISTKAGWCLMEAEMGDPKPTVLHEGVIRSEQPIAAFGPYPQCYMLAARYIADQLMWLVDEHRPDIVVIEEINLGKSRYAQRALEWIHCSLVHQLMSRYIGKIVYLSSSSWRQTLKLTMSKEAKKNNAKISKAKKMAKDGTMTVHEAKKKLGVKGKVTKKHVAIAYVNQVYGTNFKVKDNDLVDARALGMAYFAGAVHADGVM